MTKIQLVASVFLLSVLLTLFHSACTTNNKIAQERLATRYCGSCHHVPIPSSLTKTIWKKNIMPRMADYFKWSEKSRFHYANKSFYNRTGIIPMTDTIWSTLENFFVEGGLEEPSIITLNDAPNQQFFDVVQVENICSGRGITAVQIDNQQTVFMAACDSTLLRINENGEVDASMQTGGIISGIFNKSNSGYWLTDPGILDPHEGQLGSVKSIDFSNKSSSIITDNLSRPVYLNNSGDNLIISEFGNIKGALSQISQDGSNYQEISNLPGSYKSFIFDYDHDGNDEVLVMFAQALEGIYARELSANSKRFVPLISFGPEWGISDVDTADINQDGWTDLIIVNGDNADYSIIPKSYHGVRVYLNDKEGRFNEAYYFPVHGATQIRSLDANGDGFEDLLVGSFFALEEKNGIMLLLHNGSTSSPSFKPYHIPESKLGRWMVMNSGDIDQDGDEDAIIGSFNYIDASQLKSGTENSEPQTDILLLINRSK